LRPAYKTLQPYILPQSRTIGISSLLTVKAESVSTYVFVFFFARFGAKNMFDLPEAKLSNDRSINRANVSSLLL